MSVNGEYRVEDLFRCRPKFAVIQIDENNNAVQLFKDLLTKGYNSVRFFDDLCEHPIVRDRLGTWTPVKNTEEQQPKITKVVKATKVEIPQVTPETVDIQKPTTFQVQIAEKVVRCRKRTLSNGANSTGASSIASTSSPQDYDLTIDQVIGKAVLDPTALVTNLFAVEKPPQPITSVTPQPPRRKEEPTADELVQCKLCDSKIMATRFSNLANHVRRHASLKQYQCPHCSYQNNEQAKVRLHMQNQHAESKQAIIDKFSEEMQAMWGQLMDECFPNYQDILAQAKASQTKRMICTSQKNSPTPAEENNEVEETPNDTVYTTRHVSIYRCIECATIIPCVFGQEALNEGPLITHLRKEHASDCLPYKCDECDYQNAEQWKVRWHISVRHFLKADEVTVSQLNKSIYSLFIKKYFHNAQNVPNDEEESELLVLSKNANIVKTPTVVVTPPIKVITNGNGEYGITRSKRRKP